MFIFFCEKENEPKEIAPVTRPFGLPCASRIERSLWNSLTLKQPQLLLARFCDARRVTKGKVKTPTVISRPPLAFLKLYLKAYIYDDLVKSNMDG